MTTQLKIQGRKKKKSSGPQQRSYKAKAAREISARGHGKKTSTPCPGYVLLQIGREAYECHTSSAPRGLHVAFSLPQTTREGKTLHGAKKRKN